MAHTPGPWVAGNDGKHRAWIADLHNGVGVWTERRFIEGESYTWGDRNADARLIAAAPALLAALRRVASSLDLESYPDNGSLESQLGNIARAAITKATGESA